MSGELEAACARCQRANPKNAPDLPPDWEALTDESGTVIGVICPGCVTGAEASATADEMQELADESEDD